MSRAWDLLETSNLLLLAPRRVGKSSLLNRLKQDGPVRGYNPLYLSVPDAEDELDFIKRLVRGIRETDSRPHSWFSSFKEHLPEDLEFTVKTGLVELKAKKFDWRRPADELESRLKSSDRQTLFLIDELPLLVGNILKEDPTGARAERFLLWLKRLREQYQARWFFAGSIGLDTLARRHKLSGTIHDLQPLELGAFSPDIARNYLIGRGEFHGLTLDAATVDAILEAVEWPIPFHLNIVFEEIRAVAGEYGVVPSEPLVEVSLRRLMTKGRTHFDHWDERLAKMLDRHIQQYCETILTLACPEAKGVTLATIDLRLSREIANVEERAEMLRQSLDLLVSDGYLIRREGYVQFRSALLRRYWREVTA